MTTARLRPQPLFVGIAGGSGSGKTTIAYNVAHAMPRGSVVMLQHDAYYKDHSELSLEQRKRINYDHPDSLDNDLLIQHLDMLRAGQPVDMPHYDFVSHTRRVDSKRIIPAPVVVVEGILVFVDERLRDRLDVKLFVDTDSDIRVFRRIRRDMTERGRTFEEVREQYHSTVRPMHLRFVEPSKRWADIIIPEGGDNRVAIDIVLARLHHTLNLHQQASTPQLVSSVG